MWLCVSACVLVGCGVGGGWAVVCVGDGVVVLFCVALCVGVLLSSVLLWVCVGVVWLYVGVCGCVGETLGGVLGVGVFHVKRVWGCSWSVVCQVSVVYLVSALCSRSVVCLASVVCETPGVCQVWGCVSGV